MLKRAGLSAIGRWAAAVLVAAISSAFMWVHLHPHIRAFGEDGAVHLDDGARYAMFSDSGLFIVIAAVGGLVLSLGLLLQRRRGSLTVAQVSIGAVLVTVYAVLTWQFGLVLDGLLHHGVLPFPPKTLADGAEVIAALKLDTFAALAVPALVWAVVSLFDALVGGSERRG